MAGLYYYRFRDYSPDLGRFLQTDPLGYIDGMNLYAYVNNNPLNLIDPWGLCKNQTNGGNDPLVMLGTALTFLGGLGIAGATETTAAVLVPGGMGLVLGGAIVSSIGAFGVDVAIDNAVNDAVEGITEGAKNAVNSATDAIINSNFGREWQYYENNPDEFFDDILGF